MILQRLKQIILEMQEGKNYYVQPRRKQNVSIVIPGKQEEWISRLSMVAEEIKVKLAIKPEEIN